MQVRATDGVPGPLRRRLAAALGVLAVVAGSLALPSGEAAADPTYPTAGQVAESKAKVATTSSKVGSIEAQLAAASAREEQLATDVARAVEAYNGARYRLQQAISDSVAAQQQADAAKQGVLDSQRDLGAFAAAAYRSGGGLTGLTSILDANGPRDLISRASALQSIGAYREDALDRLKSSQAVAGVLQQRADDLVTKRQDAADAVTRAKQVAEAKLSDQHRAVAGIRSQRQTLVSQLAAARHTSVALERARQEGLAAARREAARKAAAAARAKAEAEARKRAADQHNEPPPSGGGMGDGGGVSGGGGGSSSGTSAGASAAIAYARAQIGKPYQWGADGPGTFDCSGLTMRAWQQGGVALPHYSVAQYQQGAKISLGELRPGDLVFFGSDRSDYRSIYHVGLYIGGGAMIEAPYTGENVRISSIWRSSLFGAARP